MPPRRRNRVALLILVALLLMGGATWWLAGVAPSPDDTAKSPAPTVAAARRRSRASASSSTPDDASSATSSPTAPRDDDADWVARLKRLLNGDASVTTESILAAAGKGLAPGGGLHEVLRRAHEERAQARSDAERRVAEQMIAWAVETALRPYRQDRALFAPLYREVRFGDGKLDVAAGSLVRSFQFSEAADRIDALRPRLQTWCYDALAVRASSTLRNDLAWWQWYGRYCASRRWDVPPAPGSQAAKTTTPAGIYGSFVRPHLEDFSSYMATYIGRVFVDLGEPDAAADLLARARRATPAPDQAAAADWYAGFLRELDAEIESFRELRSISGLRLPESPVGRAALEQWFARRRTTDVAHAIGSDGPIETGAWDDAMTASFLEGGLPWAPEQWEVERARLADAREDFRDGVRGSVVKSPNWEVFSDVSPEFAAQATLVLESAWAQAQAGLGVSSNHTARVGARIYANRAAYQAVTHDFSSGEWIPQLNSVLTFLSDPLHDDFEQFRYPTLVHEATHAALQWGVGAVPSWMNEGLACYVQRWDPTRSVAVNVAATQDWVRRPRTLEAARDAGRLPTLDELVAITGKWDVDDFGPVTSARYAAAESLFVYLADDPEHWKLVGAWLEACRRRQDPASTITADQRAEIQKGWRELVDFECARVRTK